MTDMFHLGTGLDPSQFKPVFQEKGRVEIRNFLNPDDSGRLRQFLLNSENWRLVINAGDSVYEFPRTAVQQFTKKQQHELEERIARSARHGFQYRYESIRAIDGDVRLSPGSSLLDQFVRFMSSEQVLSLLAEIMGATNLAFADGQATAYSSGHFLTQHDDDVEGKHRTSAYVLGLNPVWRPEWGGLLMFHRPDGNIDEAYVPTIGTLRLFSVPAAHSVSYVTPFATEPRLSVTGWLRTRAAAP